MPCQHWIGDASWVVDLASVVFSVVRAACRRRGDLVAENPLLRRQIAVLTRPTRRRRVGFRRRDKLLWVLIHRLRGDWRAHLLAVRPDTVARWHRTGWRLYWRWRSRSAGGRPRLSPELQRLIAPISQENPLRGSERIRGELLKLGIAVSTRSVRRYRWRGPGRPRRQAWRTLLRNHAHAIWAADLFTVQTLTLKTLYVLLFITHGRRELVHLAVTAHPTAAWGWRRLIEATAWGRRPKRLIRDRDRGYGGAFQARAKGLGIETVLTPVRSPRVNAVAERVIGTLRRECLDRVIPLDEAHLRTILAEFADHYDPERPHRTLRLETPQPAARSPTGAVLARPVLGGLHHAYARAA